MLEKLTAEEVKELVVIVLLGYHTREAERLEGIIQGCGAKSRWEELWPLFQKQATDDGIALCHFTQFVMAQLDGGSCTLPAGFDLI